MPFNSSPSESQRIVNRCREVELPRKFFNPIAQFQIPPEEIALDREKTPTVLGLNR
jgi:hypothetical protein